MRRADRIGVAVLLIGIGELLACLAAGIEGCKAVSLVGGEAAYMVIGLLVYILVDGVLGIRLVAGLALGSALGVFLKTYINLPRPPQSLWLVHASGPGFPSGHALMSALFWGIVAVEAWSPLALLGGALSVLAISESRLILHVHYLRDVVGGVAIGATLALLYLEIRRRLNALDAAALMTAAATPLALLSLAHSPGYDSAQHVTGICLGLVIGLVVLYTRTGKQSLIEKLSPLQALAALIWAGVGLIAAFALREGAASVLGFAAFALLAATSRPLALLITREGQGAAPSP